MEFGSKFVYDYTDSEEECVSDDELQEGMSRTLSDDEDDEGNAPKGGAAAAEPPAPSIPATPPPPSESAKKRSSGGILGRLFGSSGGSGSGGLGSSASYRHTVIGTLGRDEPRYAASPSGLATDTSKTTAYKRKKHHWQLFKGKSDSAVPAQERMQQQQQQQQQGKRWRRADTNIINIKFDKLTAPANMHTGDAVHCEGCQAVLSHMSKVKQQEDGDQQTWNCEFCGHRNEVDLMDEEIPNNDDVTFMLQPAPSTTASGKSGTDESVVVFLVDTSGSMCVTTEVPGTVRMRGNRLATMQSLNDTGESQYMPGQRRNVTYVSRLQGVQAAVDHQLGEMAKEHPNRRVALITFSSEVTVIGDGSSDAIHFSGDKLNNRAELIKAGSELPIPQPVSTSRKVLGDKVFDLEEGGQTALGPSLLLAVSMACQVPGSKVILCTDGLANVGLGNMDSKAGGEAYEEAAIFYDEISSMASEKGVSISVTSIKGTDCKMVELGKMASETGGQVNIVDPLKLTEEFGSILADPIIATNVTASLQVHKRLYIRNEDGKESRTVRHIGNVTKSTEITFEYGTRRHVKKMKTNVKVDKPIPEEPIYDNQKDAGYDRLKEPGTSTTTMSDTQAGADTPQDGVVAPDSKDGAVPDPSTSGEPGPSGEGPSTTSASASPKGKQEEEEDLKELPFQLKITYTDLEGAQAMRLITQMKPVTKDREQAEKEMNPAAIGVHAAQQSAHMALDGQYTTSRLNAFMYQRLLVRNTDREEVSDVYDNYITNVGRVENRLNLMQQREMRTHGRTHSDEEDDDDDMDVAMPTRPSMTEPPYKPRPFKTKSKKSATRWRSCQDDEASDMYSNAKMTSVVMKKK